MALFMWEIQSRSLDTAQTADFQLVFLLSFLLTTEMEGFQNKMHTILRFLRRNIYQVSFNTLHSL